MKVETRIVKNGKRSLSIREEEEIYDSARNDAVNEFFADNDNFSEAGFDRDFLSLRGGILG